MGVGNPMDCHKDRAGGSRRGHTQHLGSASLGFWVVAGGGHHDGDSDGQKRAVRP